METGYTWSLAGVLADIKTIVGTVFSYIMENQMLAIMFSASLVALGFYVIRKAKRTAKA